MGRWAGGNLRALLVGLREEEERRGLSRPALPENAIALPLERVVLGWVRFPGLKNVSREWIHSCCRFTASRKRQRARAGAREGRGAGVPQDFRPISDAPAWHTWGSCAESGSPEKPRPPRGRLGGAVVVEVP